MKIAKVISGGQTGADRAALDASIACGIPHGGWCPKERLAEDGAIPGKYNLRETEAEEYSVRTRANVETADLTLIFSHGPLTGGALLTQQFTEELQKPCIHIDLLKWSDIFQRAEDADIILPNSSNIILNVAGPRASSDPEIYEAVYAAMLRLLTSRVS